MRLEGIEVMRVKVLSDEVYLSHSSHPLINAGLSEEEENFVFSEK